MSDADDLDENEVDNDMDDEENNFDDDDDEDEDEDSFAEESSLNESTHSNGGNAGLGSKTKRTAKKHSKKRKSAVDASSPMSSSLLQINGMNGRSFLGTHNPHHLYSHHHNSGNSHHHHHHGGGSSSSKPARIRTVLNEKQLHMLRACYNANPRPDALMKEQLVEMTGLNPRVIRVWFQNKRCKDKKKNMLVRPEHSLQLPTLNHPHLNGNLITGHRHNLMFDNCY